MWIYWSYGFIFNFSYNSEHHLSCYQTHLYLWRLLKVLSVSHNVQGFNPPRKCKKAFRNYSNYKRLGADIILLQETHFSTNNYPQYFNKSYSQYFCTDYISKSRGTAISIRNSFVLEIHNTCKDPETHCLIPRGFLKCRQITIASIYAPNDARSTFWKKKLIFLTDIIPHT